ncbi:MAG: transposase, partial [Bacteroidota bacterium]
KKLVAVALERKNKGIGRMYARVIKNGSSPSLRPFFHDHIDKNAEIKTDEWSGYRPLKATFPHLIQSASGKKGEHFPPDASSDHDVQSLAPWHPSCRGTSASLSRRVLLPI